MKKGRVITVVEIPDREIYPHYSKFIITLASEAVQKKQDRELIEQFGKINEEEEEMIYREEQRLKR